MPQRIVVAFRGSFSARAGADYLSRALATKKRAEAHGARLCAWSAQTFSFDLAPDELEEALALAATALAATALAPTTPGLVGDGSAKRPVDAEDHRFMVGVSQGDLSHVGEGGSFATLSWGPPLLTAVALAREAAAGEVLLDRELLLARSSEIIELGWAVEPDLRRDAHRLVVPQPPQPVTESSAPPPQRRARVSVLPRGTRPPLPTAPEDAFSEMAKRALVQGDLKALERLIAQLKESGQSADAVERLSGLFDLRRGATSEALRKLRVAAEAEQPPDQSARARLAYAIALASAGRAEGSLLEALDALARAREAGDGFGEDACIRFLARLSGATGHVDAAAVWARLNVE